MASTTSAGVGRSGSPMPRLITSTPAARLSAILRSSCAYAYGGMRSRRLLGLIQLPFEVLAQATREHGPRPACQAHAQILPHLHLELPAVQHHFYARSRFRRCSSESKGNRRAARAGARGQRLPHAALEDPRADARLLAADRLDLRVPRHVRAVGELR